MRLAGLVLSSVLLWEAIALAAQRVIVDKVPIVVAGGLESISLVQTEHMNLYRLRDEWLEEHKPEVYMTMIETAEVVAKRYYITRDGDLVRAGDVGLVVAPRTSPKPARPAKSGSRSTSPSKPS